MNAITVIRPGMPDRNGLPGFRPYVYRGTGTDTLTPHLDEPENRALMPCGTEAAVLRHRRRREPLDFECRVVRAAITAERRARKRTLTSGNSFECGTGLHAPICDGRNCGCGCHR